MKTRTNISWMHICMIVIIAFMPLRALTANADIIAGSSATYTSQHQSELHETDHENCNMDAGCVTDCQLSSTHCSSASFVILSSGHSLMTMSFYQLPGFSAGQLRSISNKNLFRPPRS